VSNKPSGWLVTGIGVKPFMFVDPARAPGVRNRHGYEERTVSVYTQANDTWSRTQWHPTHCLWRSEEAARHAYAAARKAAQTNLDGTRRVLTIQNEAVRLREEEIAAGVWVPGEML